MESPNSACPFDLSLTLMELVEGKTYPLTMLLSKEYPENFRLAAIDLKQKGFDLQDNPPAELDLTVHFY